MGSEYTIGLIYIDLRRYDGVDSRSGLIALIRRLCSVIGFLFGVSARLTN